MKLRDIDRMPPPPTGDAQRDVKGIYEYLIYLREQLNAVIAQLSKGE